jgi:hypothetical protein
MEIFNLEISFLLKKLEPKLVDHLPEKISGSILYEILYEFPPKPHDFHTNIRNRILDYIEESYETNGKTFRRDIKNAYCGTINYSCKCNDDLEEESLEFNAL